MKTDRVILLYDYVQIILFTTDENILEKIAEHDNMFETTQEVEEKKTFQRPSTVDQDITNEVKNKYMLEIFNESEVQTLFFFFFFGINPIIFIYYCWKILFILLCFALKSWLLFYALFTVSWLCFV